MVQLEFAHYDYKNTGYMSHSDFAMSLVASGNVTVRSKAPPAATLPPPRLSVVHLGSCPLCQSCSDADERLCVGAFAGAGDPQVPCESEEPARVPRQGSLAGRGAFRLCSEGAFLHACPRRATTQCGFSQVKLSSLI